MNPTIAPTVKQHYKDESVAQDYDRERFSSFSGRTFDRLEKRAIRKLVRQAHRMSTQLHILDVPCGTGRITEMFLQDGFSVVGGDVSPAMLEVARRKCHRFGTDASFRELDLDAPDIGGQTFDLVSCIRLFHHLDTVDRERILGSLARLTHRFVLVNVSYSSTYYRLRRRAKRFLRQGVSRASSTWREVCRETASAGLNVVAWQYVFPAVSEDLILLLEKSECHKA
jgi:ubiquinone/menaquinone biosynthesis C-methylase UbiE